MIAEDKMKAAVNDAEIEAEVVVEEEEERKTQKPNENIHFEYTIANEMEELGASNVYAEFMQIFQRFDEQVALKMDQTKKDTSMEAIVPMLTTTKEDDGDGGGPDDINNGGITSVKGGASSGQTGASKAVDKKKPEIKMTKKQRKQMAQMKIFDLKMQVKRPDLVEAWDVTSKDPLFLLECKQVRNSVPVPRHWA